MIIILILLIIMIPIAIYLEKNFKYINENNLQSHKEMADMLKDIKYSADVLRKELEERHHNLRLVEISRRELIEHEKERNRLIRDRTGTDVT